LTFDSPDAAGALVARVLDSSLEPNRVEYLNGPALGALALGGRSQAAVAVSVGSVESAVQEQLATIEAMTRAAGGESRSLAREFWAAHAEMIAGHGRALTLQVSTLPSRLAGTVQAVDRILASLAPDETAVITGCAAIGTFVVLLGESAAPIAASFVERVRAVAGEVGGHATLLRATLGLRRAIDPWGPIEPGPMAVMRALRDEFDARRVLNPGRFVGGL
jgi:FAD/FMN-containing dehydrogenase